MGKSRLVILLYTELIRMLVQQSLRSGIEWSRLAPVQARRGIHRLTQARYGQFAEFLELGLSIHVKPTQLFDLEAGGLHPGHVPARQDLPRRLDIASVAVACVRMRFIGVKIRCDEIGYAYIPDAIGEALIFAGIADLHQVLNVVPT